MIKNYARFAVSLIFTLAVLFGLTGASSSYDALAIHKKVPNQTLTGTLTITENLFVNDSIISTNGILAPSTASATIRGYVANSATAIGIKLGNVNTLTTAGSKIVSFYSDSFATERAFLTYDGKFVSQSLCVGGAACPGAITWTGGAVGISTLSAVGAYFSGIIYSSGGNALRLSNAKADSATTTALTVDTVSLASAGAKLLSVQNNTVEKASINKDGVISAEPVYGQIYLFYDGTQKTIAATPTAGTWYPYPGAISDGPCSQMTCDGAHSQITVTVAGTYQVDIRADVTSADSGNQILVGLSVNGANPAAPCKWSNGGILSGLPGPSVSCISTFTAAQTARIVFSSDSTDSLQFTQSSMRLVRLN